MQKLISEIICQQDISRFFCSDGVCLFLCARCSGIYLGFFAAFFVFFLGKIKIQSREIRISVFFILLLGLSILLKPVGFDGNLLRYILGTLAGVACASFCLLLLNFPNSKPYGIFTSLSLYFTSIFFPFLFLLIINYNLLNIIILIAFLSFCFLSNTVLLTYLGNLKYQKAFLISIFVSLFELFIIQQIKLVIYA